MSDMFTRVEVEQNKPVQQPDQSISNLSDAQLLSEIQSLSGESLTPASEPKPIVPQIEKQPGQEQAVTTPDNSVPVTSGQVDTKQETTIQQGQSNQVPVDTAKTTFDELAKKKGFKTPEDLATSYINLEKQFSVKAAELAKIKNSEPVPSTIQQTQPVVSQPLPAIDNESIIREFQNDPIGVMAAVVKEVVKPYEQERYQNKLKSKIMNLCSNPETADFQTVEIQDQINKVLEARPQFRDNLAENIEDVYYMAKGQLSKQQLSSALEIGKQIANQQVQGKNQAIVEGANNKPGTTPVFDPATADLETLKKVLSNELSTGKNW